MNTSATETDLKLPDPIYRPDLQGRLRRGLDNTLTVLGWLVWLYLFIPLITLIGWIFGYHRLDQFVLSSPRASAYTLVIYMIVIALAGATLVLWALYNLVRFRGKERRSHPHNITEDALAAEFHVETSQLWRLQRSRIAQIHCDDDGNIAEIKYASLTPSGTQPQTPKAPRI